MRATARRDLRSRRCSSGPYLFKGTVAGNVGYGLAMRGVAEVRSEPPVERCATSASGSRATTSEARTSSPAARRSGSRSLARSCSSPRCCCSMSRWPRSTRCSSARLAEEFARIVRDTDATVVWVTHDQDEALMVADRVAIVNEGSVVACGDADSVMGLPADEWTAAFLGVEDATDGSRCRRRGRACRDRVRRSARRGRRARRRWVPAVQFAVRPEDVLLVRGRRAPAADHGAQSAARRRSRHSPVAARRTMSCSTPGA